jgi:hypothetical protein
LRKDKVSSFEANTRRLTSHECLRRLQELDEKIEACRDNRAWRRLKANRGFFSEQLLLAQEREAYEQSKEELCRVSR